MGWYNWVMKSGGIKKKPRQSGLELLRIIAMIMIVAAHLSQRGNWTWLIGGEHFTLNQFAMNVVICFGQVGVAIFFAITGYFLYNSKHYSWKRIFNVMRPTWFYSILFLVVAIIIGSSAAKFSWPLNGLVAHSILPITTNAYWFISAYIVLHLLLPYLKVWLDNLDLKSLSRLVLIVAGVLIIPNIISCFITGSISPIFTFPAAIFYTIIGYMIHRFKDELRRFSNLKLVFISCAGIMLYAAASLLIHYVSTRFNYAGLSNDILINNMSLPCMMTAVPLVIVFSRQKFVNRLINYVAGLVFGVYLIHSNGFFINYFWRENDILNTATASGYSFPHFILYFALTVFAVFCGCAIIEAIRKISVSLIKKIIQPRLNEKTKKGRIG